MPLRQLDASTELILRWRMDVAPDRLWEFLTEPGLLAQWLGRLVAGGVTADSDFVVDHGDGYCCRSRVLVHEEPHRLAFTWHFPDEPPSEIARDLVGAGEAATDLRLTHRGLGDLTASYRDGWCVHLTYLEAAAPGTPLPASMFWQLHATVAALHGS